MSEQWYGWVAGSSGEDEMAKADSSSWGDWLRSALERYERPLVRYAQRLTGDLETARDIAQDTFLSLCRQRPGAVENHLGPWLFRVCRNRALDVMKARRPDCSVDDMRRELVSRDCDPFASVERQECLTLILALVDELSPDQREVITLKFEHDMSYKEISSITGLSVSNVGFLIHVGLKTIKQRISTEAPPKEKVLRRVK
jgi:RNA polymerase sigma factor (sigma-70 family)